MLIDEVIAFMENEEKRLKELGYKDAEGMHRAFLYEISLLNKSSNFQLKLYSLGNKILNLTLIVQRLRRELGVPLIEKNRETKNLHYIEIDVEAFFHFAYSLLNVIARLTPLFYQHQIKGLPTKSFDKQRKWFIEHINLDQKYSEYLKSETHWFESFLEHRSHLTHYHPLITFRMADGSILFGTQTNKSGLIPKVVNVADFINNTANGILEFLVFYDNHFGKKTDSLF